MDKDEVIALVRFADTAGQKELVGKRHELATLVAILTHGSDAWIDARYALRIIEEEMVARAVLPPETLRKYRKKARR
jgi:hypothetical protein